MGEEVKILIIEDDEDTVEAMKLTLEAQSYTVISAYDPEEGLRKAKEEKPDLIMLDVMFGKKDEALGFDYAVRMKQESDLAPIPILMITAVNVKYPFLEFSPQTDGDYLPVDDFINKPADPEDLIGKVNNLLHAKVSKWVNWPDASQ